MHPEFLFTHSSYKWTTKTCSTPPVFTKLHSSYHLNPSQPDYAMWQCSTLKNQPTRTSHVALIPAVTSRQDITNFNKIKKRE